MTAPAWAPTHQDVADFIPARTLVGAADGYGNPLETFGVDTHPTANLVDRLILKGCAWINTAVGPLAETLEGAAAAAVACWVAAQVERAYPDTSRDVDVAAQLSAQATQMRADLVRANAAATGEDPDDPVAHLMPVWSFPAPVPWGDDDFI